MQKYVFAVRKFNNFGKQNKKQIYHFTRECTSSATVKNQDLSKNILHKRTHLLKVTNILAAKVQGQKFSNTFIKIFVFRY